MFAAPRQSAIKCAPKDHRSLEADESVIRQAISCDICGRDKQQTNHWFVAYDQGAEFRMGGWNSRTRLRPEAKPSLRPDLHAQTCRRLHGTHQRRDRGASTATADKADQPQLEKAQPEKEKQTQQSGIKPADAQPHSGPCHKPRPSGRAVPHRAHLSHRHLRSTITNHPRASSRPSSPSASPTPTPPIETSAELQFALLARRRMEARARTRAARSHASPLHRLALHRVALGPIF